MSTSVSIIAGLSSAIKRLFTRKPSSNFTMGSECDVRMKMSIVARGPLGPLAKLLVVEDESASRKAIGFDGQGSEESLFIPDASGLYNYRPAVLLAAIRAAGIPLGSAI